jgi:hypothetical protein
MNIKKIEAPPDLPKGEEPVGEGPCIKELLFE